MATEIFPAQSQAVGPQDLVDQPRETLVIEINGHLDLNENIHRANLARHICALANNGGGYVV